MKRVALSIAVGALALAISPSAHAVTWDTYWNMIGGACIPLDPAIQNNRYIDVAGGVKHASGNVDAITVYCPVDQNDDGVGHNQNPNILYMGYTDSTGTSANASVVVQFTRVTRSSGTNTSIVSLSSNSDATTTATQQGTGFSHTMDFETYAYYVRGDLDRTLTSEEVVLTSVSIQWILP